jgi:serine/threonine protein kinase
MYFVMELLEGESLSTKLRRDGKLSPSIGVHIARQMCAALHVAHSAGIIHRDLKPANVMLIHRANDENYVKVLDFGVAKSYTPDQQTQLTHTGMLVGTVEYMAPEQIMGRPVDGRTDIYALGVVMYRMLTGKPPFRDGGVPALIHAHLNVYAKPMTETAAQIPGALDRVVLRCLAKQPEQRFESMEELSRALGAALEPPSTQGLMDLEYGGGDEEADPYAVGDKTEVARPSARGPERPDPSSLENEDAFDDATVKMDRPSDRPASQAGPPPQLRLADTDNFDQTAIMSREESTAKRPIPDEITRIDSAAPRECAMCRTVNPPHVRACIACGVSLAREDQEAVRARVTAPRTAHRAAPQMPPPPPSPSYPPTPNAPFGHSPMQGAQGAQGMHGALQHPQGSPAMQQHGFQGGNSLQGVAWGNVPPHSQPPPPPSAWQRFLTWTGLRSR